MWEVLLIAPRQKRVCSRFYLSSSCFMFWLCFTYIKNCFSGIKPPKALSERLRSLRFVILPISWGSSPEITLFERESTWSSEELKIMLGREPLRKLLERSMWRRYWIKPKSSEMEPKSWLLGRAKLVTLKKSGVPGAPISLHACNTMPWTRCYIVVVPVL